MRRRTRPIRRFRLYVDESGDHTLTGWSNPDQRYLGLTGVVMENERYRAKTHPELEALKQKFFPHSPDEPVILVRNAIIRKHGVFKRMQDEDFAAAWEEALIAFFREHIRRMFTVVIDKQANADRYGSAAHHPYHYCLTVLLERYRGWLKVAGGRGDILAESRGGVPDRQLKRAYEEVWDNGTAYLSPQEIKDFLTSNKIKLKKKEANIAGLQIADCVAYPSKVGILEAHGQPIVNTPSDSTRRINKAIRFKHNQYGRVFLG